MPRPVSLVTGASGFIGSHMLEVLREAGHQIRATDLPGSLAATPAPGRYPDLVRSLAAEIVPADLCHDGLAELVKGVDYVFHIAGLFKYSAPPQLLEAINVGGSIRLLEALQLHNPGLRRFVLWGAGGAYGKPNPDLLPMHEDTHPKLPQTAYLQSKWRQEQAVGEFCEANGLSYATLRPTTVYGPRGVYGGGSLMVQAAVPKPKLPRNFTFRIPFVHARDVARAALHVATHPKAHGQAFNLVDDTPYRTVDFFRMMAERQGRTLTLLPPIPIALLRWGMKAAALVMEPLAKRSGKTPLLERDLATLFGWDFWMSNDKLHQLGFEFEYPDVAKGVPETLDWLKEAGLLTT